MAGHPSAGELVAAVREFLVGLTASDDAPPALAGRAAFHAKVAANVLAIVARELAGEAVTVETMALRRFAPTLPPSTGELRAALCAAIRSGTSDTATPGLIDALIIATRARLTIDNPRYATLDRLAAPPTPDAALR